MTADGSGRLAQEPSAFRSRGFFETWGPLPWLTSFWTPDVAKASTRRVQSVIPNMM